MLLELYATLKPSGVLFSSNPRGNNEEGWNGGRYGAGIVPIDVEIGEAALLALSR